MWEPKLLVIAALLNSALFLAGIFVAGLVLHNPLAWKLALVSAGLCFLCYVTQYLGHENVAATLASTSIVAGAVGGVALLIWS